MHITETTSNQEISTVYLQLLGFRVCAQMKISNILRAHCSQPLRMCVQCMFSGRCEKILNSFEFSIWKKFRSLFIDLLFIFHYFEESHTAQFASPILMFCAFFSRSFSTLTVFIIAKNNDMNCFINDVEKWENKCVFNGPNESSRKQMSHSLRYDDAIPKLPPPMARHSNTISKNSIRIESNET